MVMIARNLLFLVLIGAIIGQAVAAYCPHRPEEHCETKWSGQVDSFPSRFWNAWTCQARPLAATPGTPCYDTTPFHDLMFGNPSAPSWTTADGGHKQAHMTGIFPPNNGGGPFSDAWAVDDASDQWKAETAPLPADPFNPNYFSGISNGEGWWTQLKREAQIGKPTTHNFGQVGHIAAFETGDGRPFIINHGMLRFQRNAPIDGLNARRYHLNEATATPEDAANFVNDYVVEHLSRDARWTVCTTPDCSRTTEPESFIQDDSFATYFNWNPCGQSSSVHVWVKGQKRLTFVGVGSRSTWTDSRVVFAQCVDAACSSVTVREIGGNLRDLPAVEHQCLGGKFGVGARIVIASDGNPSIMWRNKQNPSDVVYVHCKNAECTDFSAPQVFQLESEKIDITAFSPQMNPTAQGSVMKTQVAMELFLGHKLDSTTPVMGSSYTHWMPALWWNLVSSEKGIWIVSLHQANKAFFDKATFMQVTPCTDTRCQLVGEQYPTPPVPAASTGPDRDRFAKHDPFGTSSNEFNNAPYPESKSFWAGHGWSWSINSYGAGFVPDDEQNWYTNPTMNHRSRNFNLPNYPSGPSNGAAWSDDEYTFDQLYASYRPNIGDVAFASQTFSAGLTGDGFPMWVGQAENGPQSSVAWLVCSCRDASCEQPECHILADSDSVMDPSMRQCVKWEDATNRRRGYRSSDRTSASAAPDGPDAVKRHHLARSFNTNFKKNPLEIRGGHYSSRHRILNGASRDLPIIVQHISSFCVQLTGGDPSTDPYHFMVDAYAGLKFQLHSPPFAPTPSFVGSFPSASPSSGPYVPSNFYSGWSAPSLNPNTKNGWRFQEWWVGDAQQWDPRTAYQSRSVFSPSPTNRKVLLQSYKSVYIHCLDATCSEATVSALQSPRISSVSHESGYNQIESLIISPDNVLTIIAPDATFSELSYSWAQTDSYLPRNAQPRVFDFDPSVYTVAGTSDKFPGLIIQDLLDWSEFYQNSDPVFNTPYANELGTPTYAILQDVLGIHPTPRTAGWKTWMTNRWSSPNGIPCQSSQAGRQISADGVVFICTGLDLGDDQRWGTSPVEGWTRFWEWKEIGWGLRWRWQGDVHLGTDRIMDQLYERIMDLSAPTRLNTPLTVHHTPTVPLPPYTPP